MGSCYWIVSFDFVFLLNASYPKHYYNLTVVLLKKIGSCRYIRPQLRCILAKLNGSCGEEVGQLSGSFLSDNNEYSGRTERRRTDE